MSAFRKKPVVIEAVQYDSMPMTEGFDHPGVCICEASPAAHVHTIHANQIVVLEIGDWIIPEPDGVHYYPCKPDIFAATYEPADTPVVPEPWVVWSNEHGSWWAPNRQGYRLQLGGAGIYTEAEARDIERNARHGGERVLPPEVAMSLATALRADSTGYVRWQIEIGSVAEFFANLLGEAMPNPDDRHRGLYDKYSVRYRAPGSGSHIPIDFQVFVLDLDHDQFADAALHAYLDVACADVGVFKTVPDFPEHRQAVLDAELYDTNHDFVIERTDGQSAPGAKHHGCRYLVLRFDADVGQSTADRAAIAAYADACAPEYNRLALDLRKRLRQ